MVSFDSTEFKKCASRSTNFRREGNTLYAKKHDEDSHTHILSMYSKSIAFAPENSEELALGFGNRSALLKHVQKYKECIIDIDKALSISKSDEFKTKMLSRKTECLKLMKEPIKYGDSYHNNSIPTIIPSKKVSCVSENLSLKYSEKYGKHMVANQNLKPGTVIALEKAYIAFPHTYKLYLVCSHCLTQTFNSIPCDFCPFSIYCSENCKKQAWKEYHDIECSVMPTICPPKDGVVSLMDNSTLYRAALRIFIKMLKSHSLEKIVQEVKSSDSQVFNGYFSCHQFLSNFNLASQTSNLFRVMEMKSKNFITKSINLLSRFESIFTDKAKSKFDSEYEMLEFAKQLLTKFLNILEVNSNVYQGTMDNCKGHFDVNYESINCESRGIILSPCVSLFNHSCVPNSDALVLGKTKVMIVTNQPIKKGEQLFVNYFYGLITLSKPRAERQYLLQQKFSFNCDCQACSENWPPPVNEDKFFTKSRMMELSIENMRFCKKMGIKPILPDPPNSWKFDEKSYSQILNVIETIYKICNNYDASVVSYPYNAFILLALSKFYGIEWDSMSDCRNSV